MPRFFRSGWIATILLGSLLVRVSTAEPTPEHPLAKQVQIRRTAYGVPHITGATFEAAAFGLAYCQAEDHFPNILEGYIAARGELAATYGGKENAVKDLQTRRFRVRARAIETYHRLEPEFRELAEGFAAGLNYYIAVHQPPLPDGFRPITGHDVAAHGNTGVMRFAFDRGGIIRKFHAAQKGAAVGQRDGVNEDIFGSNMWAFAPSRTKSGHTILMGNPHQGWSPVSTYYEAHLIVPDKMNFYGSTFIGRPVLTTGFNEYLGWSHTVNYPDLEEIYELRRDPNQPNYFLFDGDAIEMTKDEITIQVKDAASVTDVAWHTPLGPVIHETPDSVYILRSACYDEYRSYGEWFRMSLARDRQQFEAALQMQAIPMFNICYADRAGNIAYLWNGTIPVFPHPAHDYEPVVARGSGDIWTRFHPLRDLPHLINPKGGYVQNCNAPPYFTNLHQPLDIHRYPDYFERHRLGFRTQHSLALIHNDNRYTLEEVRDLKFSETMYLATRMKPDLLRAAEDTSDPKLKAAAEVLRSWDDRVAADSKGAVLFESWWRHYAHRPGDDLSQPVLPDTYVVAWRPEEPMSTPRGIGNPERALRALEQAADETTQKFGSLEVAWGDVHRVRKGDLDLPIGGGSGFLGCFRVLDFTDLENGKRYVRGGDSWVFAVEFSDPPRAYSVIGYSQSEIPASPYFSDQTRLFAQDQMKRVAFTEDEINQQTIQAYRPGEEVMARK
jgi:acyl-homoserine-lactone acylase